MQKHLPSAFVLFLATMLSAPVMAVPVIEAVTDHAALVWDAENGSRTLWQRHFGAKPARDNALAPAYPTFGNGYLNEPALRVTHADGNTSTDLVYVSHVIAHPADGVTLTRIELKDRFYPFFVTVCCRAHAHTDIFELWSEYRHEESGPVTLYNFASASPVIPRHLDTLTHFHGDWGTEAGPVQEKLTQGVKFIDSKRCSRAQQRDLPMFLLSQGQLKEESGEVIGGALAWPGNFQLAFDRNNFQLTVNGSEDLRAICGMNPIGSQYRLEVGTSFVTPSLVMGYSNAGVGNLSRNFHRFARRNILRDGDRSRAILLNNWEATDMDFDEKKIIGLFDGAKAVGMDLFLLDDGWFGEKFTRENAATAGLGDWMPNPKKLPHGVEALAQEAVKRGLRFGIWMEPEMVNPNSELFTKHPDWVLRQPHRDLQENRNQVVLDLCNPAVEEYVFKCVDDLLTNAPSISCLKWDCNSQAPQPGSPYLSPRDQSHVFIDYNRALCRIMEKVTKKHPKVEMMLCAGGSGRVDFGSLRYGHTYWPSDNTNPYPRMDIQRSFSYFFPVMASANHVTLSGQCSLKFRFDEAMSGCLGMDMDLQKLSSADLATVASCITAYKSIRDIVQLGDQYRLENRQENHARETIDFVAEDKTRAVLMVYQTATVNAATPVKLNGLDPAGNYRVKEINLPAGVTSKLAVEGKVLSGKVLMETGLIPPCTAAVTSAIITFTEEGAGK